MTTSDEITNTLVKEIRGSLQASLNKISGRIRSIITKPYEDEIAALKSEIAKPLHDEYRSGLYDRMLAIFVNQSRKIGRSCERSREIGRGSFGWLDDPDAKIEWEAYHALERYLAREYLILDGMDKMQRHGKACIECESFRYDVERRSWNCQEECEDK
jgi:hypothetical protein